MDAFFPNIHIATKNNKTAIKCRKFDLLFMCLDDLFGNVKSEKTALKAQTQTQNLCLMSVSMFGFIYGAVVCVQFNGNVCIKKCGYPGFPQWSNFLMVFIH